MKFLFFNKYEISQPASSLILPSGLKTLITKLTRQLTDRCQFLKQSEIITLAEHVLHNVQPYSIALGVNLTLPQLVN